MRKNKPCNSPPRRNKIVTFVLVILVVVFAFSSAFFAIKSGTFSLLLIKLGLKDDIPINTDSYKAWSNCLKQLNIDVDIAFIGDSITANGDFQSLLPDKKVCNLGCYGDQIWDVTARINAVRAVNPETICIMIGINTLGCRTLEQAMHSYLSMVDTYTAAFPECKIVLLSVLPVSHQFESGARTNKNIQEFNTFVQSTASNHNAIYINLYSMYELDGVLNQEYTEDGLHIIPKSYSLWIDAIRLIL